MTAYVIPNAIQVTTLHARVCILMCLQLPHSGLDSGNANTVVLIVHFRFVSLTRHHLRFNRLDLAHGPSCRAIGSRFT